jgi:hypothetical protein
VATKLVASRVVLSSIDLVLVSLSESDVAVSYVWA